jgi:hypothetical protein
VTVKQWYFPLARVKQRDDYGCAMASSAIVCGLTYSRMRSEFFPKRRHFTDDRSLCVRGDHMLRVINRLGFTAKYHTGSFKHLKCPVIVPFAWFPPDTDWIHCVVWDPFEKRYIDPGPDHERHMSQDEYSKLWSKSDYRVIVVTGKRATP